MNSLVQALISSQSFLLLSSDKYSPLSSFIGPGLLRSFVQGVVPPFDEFHGLYTKTFTDTNGLNDATQHNFQCKQNK